MGKGLNVLTGIRYAKGQLETLLHMTYLYDANWGINNSQEQTFPMCFYYLKDIKEQMSSDISTNPVMMYYETADSFLGKGITGGVTQVIADNIILKPKTYILEVILPFNLGEMYYNAFNTNRFSQVMTTLTDNGGGNIASAIENTVRLNESAWLATFKQLLTSLIHIDVSNADSMVSSFLVEPTYNKDSLVQMWKNRSILKMKMWEGFKFKYGVITNLEITKPVENATSYEASITFSELPILSLAERGDQTFKKKNFTSFAGNILHNLGELGG